MSTDKTTWISPFSKFSLPRETELFTLWRTHYQKLNIRYKHEGPPQDLELLVSRKDHERELNRKL